MGLQTVRRSKVLISKWYSKAYSKLYSGLVFIKTIDSEWTSHFLATYKIYKICARLLFLKHLFELNKSAKLAKILGFSEIHGIANMFYRDSK